MANATDLPFLPNLLVIRLFQFFCRLRQNRLQLNLIYFCLSMFPLFQAKKLIPCAFICVLFCLIFNQRVKADAGCRYTGGGSDRVYYRTTTVGTPNNTYEYFTNEYWIQFSSSVSCNSSPYQTSTYVKSAEVTTRTDAKGGRCYVNFANSYALGTPVTFVRTYQCPIDDYIPFLLLIMLPVSIGFVRRKYLVNC